MHAPGTPGPARGGPPNLDDRTFQDIVDQAKRLIPRYCPEWTDHNVSDPGVALIELFAWMTELLLYRVNAVPDRMQHEFMRMLGVRLAPARAATAQLTFRLGAPQPHPVIVPAGTEVATVRTEHQPAIVFTTEADLRIDPPRLAGLFTATAAPRDGTPAWLAHDADRHGPNGQGLLIFPAQPTTGDALYLAFENELSQHALTLRVQCETASGAGIDPTAPPTTWEVWQGPATRWAPCTIDADTTLGFNRTGELTVFTPNMVPAEFHGVSAYWLRCRLNERQAVAGYRVSPEVQRLRVEATGGTVTARHATTVRDEVLGRSEGTPGQRFRLRHAPVLARDAARDHLTVTPPDGPTEVWTEVADFAASGPHDTHYTLHDSDGTVTLGPALPQPDGSMHVFGRIPPRGATLRFTRYATGGGTAGNVPAGALNVLRRAVPYVSGVTNRRAAGGGRDPQNLEDARTRLPAMLRAPGRAVTIDDYEELALAVDGVARVRCLTPSTPGVHDLPPGHVRLVVLPVRADHGAPDQTGLSAELRGALLDDLDRRRPAGTALDVIAPVVIRVTVRAALRAVDTGNADLHARLAEAASRRLRAYLDPYRGGPEGRGWPFGRPLHPAELYGVLQNLPGLDHVELLTVSASSGRDSTGLLTNGPVSLPPHGLIASGTHEVTVS